MLHIYKASAGSGKTFRLAYEYIRLILLHRDEDTGRMSINMRVADAHRAILAITFTNKATEEMKQRILHELALLGGREPGWESERSAYEDMLLRETGIDPGSLSADSERARQALRRAASTALDAIVMDFNNFNISTIDSFFQVILRTFAREAQVLGDYEVSLDDYDSVRKGVADVLADLRHGSEPVPGDNSRLSGWLLDFMEEKFRNGQAFNLFNQSASLRDDVVRMINDLMTEEFKGHYDAMMEYLRRPDNPLGAYKKALKERLAAIDREAVDSASSMLGRYAPFVGMAGANGKERGVIKKTWLNALQSIVDCGGLPKSPSKMPPKVCDSPEEAINASGRGIVPQSLIEDGADTAAAIVALGAERATIGAVSNSLFVLGLLDRVFRAMDMNQRDNNTILLSNTNSLLAEIIGDDDAPFIYERTGMRLRHFLIDEFQDTSRMQWRNLAPLVRESHSEGCDNLIIGDEKQCIYRFRNSDPSLLQHIVPDSFDNKSIKGDRIEENTNWRSSRNVVEFNNEFFTRVAEIEGFQDIYAGVCQQVSPKHAGHEGYVSVTPIDESGAADYAEATLRLMGEEIMEQLADGYRPCDIAVLTRKVKEARAVISYLINLSETLPEGHRFAVISDDSLRVDAAPGVRIVIAQLRAMGADDNAPDRKVSERHLARMLHGYECRMNDYVVRCGSAPGPLECGEILKETVRLYPADGGEETSDLPRHGGRLDADTVVAADLVAIVEKVVAGLPAEILREQNMFLTALLDAVAEYSETGLNDIRSFLRWWDVTGRFSTVSSPADENAIRVMTIHKAKGLEFGCVNMPFASVGMVDNKSRKWFPAPEIRGVDREVVPPVVPVKMVKELEGTSFRPYYESVVTAGKLDEVNILYVALTRAVDRLYIHYGSSGRGATTGDLFNAVLPHMPSMERSDDGRFFCGAKHPPFRGKESPRKGLEPELSGLMPPLRIVERTDLWSDTCLRIPEHYVESDMRSRGNVLHAALAKVRRPGDVDKAVGWLVACSMLRPLEADSIRALLVRELRRPEVAQWFEGTRRVLRERPVYTGRDPVDAEVTVTYRPDRVVWTEAGTVDVIDYKTGSDEDFVSHLGQHKRQVARYMELMEHEAGGLPVRGFVWHLDSGRIEAVGR